MVRRAGARRRATLHGETVRRRAATLHQLHESVRRATANGTANEFRIRAVDVGDAEAQKLMGDLDLELNRRYPGVPTNGIDAAEFRAAGGYFVLLDAGENDRMRGIPIAGAGCVEIKRMFVRETHRGRGYSRRSCSASKMWRKAVGSGALCSKPECVSRRPPGCTYRPDTSVSPITGAMRVIRIRYVSPRRCDKRGAELPVFAGCVRRRNA